MDTEQSSSPDLPGPPPADIEARLQTAVEEFLAALQAGERPDRAQAVAEQPELAPWLDERLKLVELVFQAAQDGDADHRHLPGDRAKRLKCPHCGNQVQLVEPRNKEVTCLNCGSSFRVEPDATATYQSSRPAGEFGRFQVIELLGRGAFGEVYKARDRELDRFVALKVPRADYFANSEETQRFLREARAAAGLRHASIVQVHEIAHERGSPYIVSDYIEGLTLADLISGGRPGFRESAELLAQLADAVDYAHRQKVIHRDIKPSNILLTMPEGKQAGGPQFVPFLTDFGLARRDEGEITVTLDGQVLGTPAYMSPEQAAGDHARVDGRSDVYSLGVVLYELLSGELPFRGSRRMLLHQVLHDEPRPPRTLNDRIPRDLETICLKAMAKEPSRRYHTAADFRDDLRRFLRGDPITARRVGRTERTWRWCRRNPAIASLAASLAAALVVGTGVSSYLAVAEREARIDADTLKRKAIADREQAERLAARSLIAPLNPDGPLGEPLSRPEREALWEVATLPDDAVWLRFIDEGAQDPKLAPALCARSEPAMIAAVGLNLKKRDRAAALLTERVIDTSLSIHHRAVFGLIGLELVEEPGPLAEVCTAVIREAMAAAHESVASPRAPWLVDHFWRAESHVEPNTLANLIAEWLQVAPLREAPDVIAGIADRLDPAAAERVERVLHAVLQRTTSLEAKWNLAIALTRVSKRLDGPSAMRVRREAARPMKDVFNEQSSLGNVKYVHQVNSMVDLAMQMEPVEGVALLTEALTVCPHFLIDVLVYGLSTVAAKLDDVAGAHVCINAARILVERMRKSATADLQYELPELLQGIPIVTERMERAERLQVYEEAAGVLAEAEVRAAGSLNGDVGKMLAEITGKLPPDDAARVCAPVVDVLTKALGVETDPLILARLASAWAPLAKHVAEPDAQRVRAEVTQKLCHVLSTTKPDIGNAEVFWEIIDGMSRLAAGMNTADAADASRDAVRVLVALLKEYGAGDDIVNYKGPTVGSMLSSLAPLMSPDEARTILLEALFLDPGHSPMYATAFVAVVRRMDPVQRARVCAEAIDLVLDRVRSTADAPMLSGLAKMLAQIAAEMGSDEARPACAEAARALIKSMRTVPVASENDLQGLATSVLVIASRLKPVERAQICTDAARAMIEIRRQDGWANYWAADPWPRNMTLLTAEMDPRDAAQLVESALRVQLAAQLRSVRAGLWNIRFESALADCLALCDDRTASETTWLLAQILCSDACAAIGGGTLYKGSRFDDLLSVPPPKSAVEGAEPPARGCRLTTTQLVELLKIPTCFGAARRLILDHLERRYGRRFNTVWAFVRFAEEQKLGLDFTTPPVRPDPAKMQVLAP